MHWKIKIIWIFSRAIIAYCLAAGILFFLGDYKKACIKRLNTITEWGDYPMLLTKNKGIYEKRRLYMAIRYYKILRDLIPQSGQPDTMIGYCYFLLNENDLSIKYFKRAIIKRPDYFWNDYNLGQLYYRSGRLQEALVKFQGIMNYDSDSLIKAVILAPLNTMVSDQRQQFYLLAKAFASDIKSSSLKMIIKINLKNQPDQLKYFLNDQHDSLNEAVELMFHPWAYFIQPGKEVYF